MPRYYVAAEYTIDPVQEDKKEPSTEHEVNQYSKAPGRKDTELPSTEYKNYDVQVQGDSNKTSTLSSNYEVREVNKSNKPPVEQDISSTKDKPHDVLTVQEESKPIIESKQTPPPIPLKKPTKIMVLKPPKNNEKPGPKTKRKQNSKITKNQSKITSMFKPLNNPSKPEHKTVSETPQYHQTSVVAGEVSWVNQDNQNDSESSDSLGNTCPAPDLAINNSFQT